jgi:hypothetical protein
MAKIRLSHSQRELYSLCGRKYYYRYVKKMRPRAKGSALFFGTAFDDATDKLFQGDSLQQACDAFTEEWMRHEDNLNVKFAKNDYDDRILESYDIERLTLFSESLNNSKAVQDYSEHKNVKKLIKDLIKLRDNGYTRDLSDKEERFLHYANMLCMNRKGHLMLESFNKELVPHVTKVHGTQVAVNISHPDGHSVMGYIDLLCEMAGYKLPNGRVLKEGEVVVIDVKSAGAMSWKKHDDLYAAPQLDTYLISPNVQDLAIELTGKETNLIGYFVTSKQIRNDVINTCKSCGNIKSTSHKTCNAEVDGKRCNGEWDTLENYYVESKAVVGERDLDEARVMYSDFEDVLVGIQAKVFPRNRNSCEAFGGICEYKSICGKCFEDPEKAIEDWKKELGEDT